MTLQLNFLQLGGCEPSNILTNDGLQFAANDQFNLSITSACKSQPTASFKNYKQEQKHR